MKITKDRLKQIIKEELEKRFPVKEEKGKFAPTASEEAMKINKQAGPNEMGMTLVTDQEFWEKMGVRTGEDLAKHLLAGTIRDMYKDIHGIRPPSMSLKDMTVDELSAEIDKLSKELPVGEEEPYVDIYGDDFVDFPPIAGIRGGVRDAKGLSPALTTQDPGYYDPAGNGIL